MGLPVGSWSLVRLQRPPGIPKRTSAAPVLENKGNRLNKRRTNYTEEDLGYPTEPHGRIPSFANRDEEAAFWDTHDLTEFEGVELQPGEVTLGGELAERLTVRLDQEDRNELQRRAKALGVGPSTLVRMWVKERLAKSA